MLNTELLVLNNFHLSDGFIILFILVFKGFTNLCVLYFIQMLFLKTTKLKQNLYELYVKCISELEKLKISEAII